MTRKVYRKTIACSVLTLLLGSALPVSGADSSNAAFHKRWYLGAGIGQSSLEPRSSTPALAVTEDADSSFGLQIGLDLSPRFTLDLYAHELGGADVSFLDTPVGTVDYSVYGLSLISYLANFGNVDDDLYKREGLYLREGLSPYFRLGIGVMENDSDQVNYTQEHKEHLALGLGLEYGWSNGLALRAEYSAYDKDAKELSLALLKRFGKVSHTALAAAPVAVAVPVVAIKSQETPVPYTLDAPLVFFDFNAHDIKPDFVVALEQLGNDLRDRPELMVQIDGHADNVGSEDFNVDLSMLRADSVRSFLISAGIPANRLATAAYGEHRPIASNDTEDGRARNRRVEISRAN